MLHLARDSTEASLGCNLNRHSKSPTLAGVMTAEPLSAIAALLAHPLVARVRALAEARRTAVLLVGGAVRDAILGREVHDFDFAVQGGAVRLARAVADALEAHFYVLDAERDIGRVLIPARPGEPQVTLDFAACVGSSWAEDQRARDFTVNAIGVELSSGALVDATGGLRDLREGMLRLTHPAAVRADPVRALRGVRLSHALNLRLDEETARQLSAARAWLMQPSAERLRDELFEMLKLPRASAAIRMLDDLGLLEVLLPEVRLLCEQPQAPHYAFNVLAHSLHALAALDEEGYALLHADRETRTALEAPSAEARTWLSLLRFAALMHDCGKPEVAQQDGEGRWRFPGHAERSAERAAQRARALRLSAHEIAWLRTCIAHHTRLNEIAAAPALPSDRVVYRLLKDLGEVTPAAALLVVADCWARRAETTSENPCEAQCTFAQQLTRAYFQRWLPLQANPPLVNGHDLLALGVPHGPRIGEILEAVREARFCGEVQTREEALALAEHLAVLLAGRMGATSTQA